MDTPAQIWHLIARSLNGEASLREQEELLEMLQQDELLQQQYDLLSRIWKEKQEANDEDSDAAQNTISKIITRAELEERHKGHIIGLYSEKRRLSKRKVWIAAASVIIIISAAAFWISNLSTSQKEIKQEALEARKGSRSRSLLPDGTTVWLNAGSKIYYDGDFTGPTREVRLEGEAFFDVVKQTDRPFIVHTSGIDIKVLGTAFNVKSYPEDKTVETTLYRGLVQVFRHEETEKKAIQLKPNQKLIFPKQAANETLKLSEDKVLSAKETPASFTIDHIDSTKKESERIETAWVYSRLEFRGDNFEELARKLERWYNVTIFFTDEKVKQLSLNGSFERETVEQAFLALKEGFPINFKINNHEIYVSSSQ
jgi:ferric-dicitrate binding protein FerR (iron transport regulator)